MTDATPVPAAPAPAATVPGKTLGIVALIVSFFFAIVGAILGFVALSQSKKAGAKNGPAVAAIVIGLVLTVIWLIVVIGSITAASALLGNACAELGSGVWDVDGVTYTCP